MRADALGLIFLCNFVFSKIYQDWGYVTVRPRAHMFWWLYYTSEGSDPSNDQKEKPLIIWLQGGPGESSTGIGNFVLIGPEDINSMPRKYTWVNDFNVLFIDAPVGAGFSYAESEFEFSINNEEIARDILTCMKEFLKQKPEFKHVPMYIAGDSYGAKIAIQLANMWYKEQVAELISSNLKGVLLESPWISPWRIISSYGEHLLNLGVIDLEGRNEIERFISEIVSHINKNQLLQATNTWIRMRRKILEITKHFNFDNFMNEMPAFNNHRKDNNDILSDRNLDIYMNGPVRKKLDINCTVWGHQKGDVQFYLFEDLLRSVFDEVKYALQNTVLKIYIYIGQMSSSVDVRGTFDWIDALDWPDKNNWKQAPRNALIVDGKIGGYYKTYGRFAVYMISRAGQMVPKDNPAAALRVIQDLTKNHL